jgi:hypothetical protein
MSKYKEDYKKFGEIWNKYKFDEEIIFCLSVIIGSIIYWGYIFYYWKNGGAATFLLGIVFYPFIGAAVIHISMLPVGFVYACIKSFIVFILFLCKKLSKNKIH